MAAAGPDSILRRDRTVLALALAGVVLLAWAYVAWLAADMSMGGMDMTGFRMIPAGMGLMMPALEPWRGIEFAFVFIMWAVMMIAMMLPSAAPMILLYARVGRQARLREAPFAATGWFAGGYLLAWAAFSALATLAQWGLERAALLDPMMTSTSDVLGGLVLVAAGIYQWTPLKHACLTQCQAPLAFLQRSGGFRRDAGGALLLGLRHGAYCVGCCWALMLLLFVLGVMNVLWIAGLAILILAEKLLPFGRLFARITGLALALAGAWLLAGRPGFATA